MSLVSLELRSLDDIEKFRTRLRSVRVTLPGFQKATLRNLVNQLVLDAIHRNMEENDFSEKIIAGTIIKKVELIARTKLRITIISEYFTEAQFDVALAREEGTRRHFIEPVEAQALRFIQEGVVKFSKGHEVEGIKALKLVAKTIKEMTPEVQSAYEFELKTWLGDNFRSL